MRKEEESQYKIVIPYGECIGQILLWEIWEEEVKVNGILTDYSFLYYHDDKRIKYSIVEVIRNPFVFPYSYRKKQKILISIQRKEFKEEVNKMMDNINYLRNSNKMDILKGILVTPEYKEEEIIGLGDLNNPKTRHIPAGLTFSLSIKLEAPEEMENMDYLLFLLKRLDYIIDNDIIPIILPNKA